MTDKPNNKKKGKINLDPNFQNSFPPLNQDLDEYLQPGLHEALTEFTTQAQIYFPQILNDERDLIAAKIHLDNLQEQLNRTNKNLGADSEKVMIALTALLKIGEKRQNDMMACALLDYIDEILEMMSSNE